MFTFILIIEEKACSPYLIFVIFWHQHHFQLNYLTPKTRKSWHNWFCGGKKAQIATQIVLMAAVVVLVECGGVMVMPPPLPLYHHYHYLRNFLTLAWNFWHLHRMWCRWQIWGMLSVQTLLPILVPSLFLSVTLRPVFLPPPSLPFPLLPLCSLSDSWWSKNKAGAPPAPPANYPFCQPQTRPSNGRGVPACRLSTNEKPRPKFSTNENAPFSPPVLPALGA